MEINKIPLITVKIQFRFWLRVDRKSDKECWPWLGGKTVKEDHGQLRIGKHKYLASRISYKLHKTDPGELLVCHSCNNPVCVNPNHLYLGTQSDNVKYAYLCDRRDQTGSNNTSSKLNESQVLQIRTSYKEGVSQKELSLKYNVSVGCIQGVVDRTNWRNI